MVKSKGWNWNTADKDYWTKPSMESYYYANKWQQEGCKEILDLGCGIGRHAILFSQCGFHVTGCDIAPEGLEYLKEWAAKENADIVTQKADMLNLPFEDASFDCVWAYHSMSHTDTEGIVQIIGEVNRVLRSDGNFFFDLCSKKTWSFTEGNFPHIDENTLRITEGEEEDIPHYFVDLEDVERLLKDFILVNVRHIDDCYENGTKQKSLHYFIEAKKK